MKIYVACGLTHAPDAFKNSVYQFKDLVKAEQIAEILDFIDISGGTAEQVYNHDIHCVRTCDALVAFLDYPSIGVGMELQEALRERKPVLCLFSKDSRLTRMVLGPRDMGLLTIMQYSTLQEAVASTKIFLSEFTR